MITNGYNTTFLLCKIGALFALCVATSAAGYAAANTPAYQGQMVFDTPEAAGKRLATAVSSGDRADIEAIFGTEARETLSSGDPVADRHSREVVAVAMNEKWTMQPKDATTCELVIGNESWPFPIPLVKDERGWWFDTAAGKEEIRVRRIGRNELATIRTLRAYAIAQKEYAQVGRDGKPAGIFAQQIRSDPGKHNGLYWPVTDAKEPRSPLGEFVAAATAEGYGMESKEGAAPYNGYYYRVLKSQGTAAPGGAKEYVVNGDMTGGFAMLAYPAEYGSSGVMSFLVGPDGIVHESDLGNDTATVAKKIVSYDPGDGWQNTD